MPVRSAVSRLLPIPLLVSALAIGAAAAGQPSATAAESAQVASTGPGVLAVIESGRLTGVGASTVVGVIENRGTDTIEEGHVSVEQRDASGALLTDASAGGLLTWLRLDPGQRAGFHTTFSPVAGYHHYTLATWVTSQGLTPANRRFTVSAAATSETSVSGTYRNDNNVTADRILVTAIFRDAAGKVVDVTTDATGLGSSFPVGPGESRGFTVRRSGNPWTAPEVPHVTASVVVESADELSPLPLNVELFDFSPVQDGGRLLFAGYVRKKHANSSAPGLTTILERRRVGTSAWARVANVVADEVGYFNFGEHVVTKGWEYRARVDGTTTLAPSVSTTVRPRMKWLVELSGPAKSVRVGRTFGLSVQTTLDLGKRTAILQRQQGKKWVRVDDEQVSKRKGRAFFTTSLTTAGSYKFRVLVRKYHFNPDVTSKVVTVRVVK